MAMEANSVSRQYDWLALALLPGLGPVRWQQLLASGADPLQLMRRPQALFPDQSLPSPTREALRAWRSGDQAQEFLQRHRRARESIERLGVSLLCWDDPDYPPLLRHIHAPPAVLFVRGDRRLLARPQIAVVGSRKASREGLRNAHELAAELAAAGVAVTSGLALGVDAAAHEGALSVSGDTVAVLGTGIDKLYPNQNRRLGQQVIERGLVLSELAPGTPGRPGHFPRRNRIISGLAQGVLVVEAGVRSGSLITARLALEQGREVFAVPGSIRNPGARGCHQLLRQGAVLVESAEDILAELSPYWREPEASAPARQPAGAAGRLGHAQPNPQQSLVLPEGLPPEQCRILQVLEHQVCSSDELVDATGLAPDVLMQAVTLLEMEGWVLSVPGGFQRA